MASKTRGCLRCGKPFNAGAAGARRGICASCTPTLATPGPLAPAAGLLGRPVASRRSTRTTPVPPPGGGIVPEREMPPTGTDLGGLVVLRPLGRGGMGLVVVARDAALEREVAVKFLGSSLLGSERAVRWFRREGRALAGIRHPNVVAVYAVGDWQGWPYLVMELVEGTPLGDRIRRGPAPPEEALRIAEDLASALAAIHGRGVVHGDVTPANVLLRPDDGPACLIDFGLAREIDRKTWSSSEVIAGTLPYMAPEVVSNRRRDRAVDVYAFGVTLFQMLAGRVPREAMDTAPFLYALLHEDVPLLRSVVPGAPRELEVLLARLLARAPELRPASGIELLAEIRDVRASLAARAAEPAAQRTRTQAIVPPVPYRDPSEETPFLGRDAEYRAAACALDEAVQRRGRVILVEGPAGSGKSRFAREVERAARARAMEVLRCPGERPAGAPFGPLRAALLEDARRRGEASPDAILSRVLDGAPAARPLANALRWILDPGGAGTPPVRPVAAAAFQALLRSVLSDRPVLVCADDAHDLDEGSLDLLAGAAREGAGWPLAILLAGRPIEDARRGAGLRSRLAGFRAMEGAVDVRLGPLSQAAVAVLVHVVLGVDESEACRLAPVLHKKSEGNPLYVLESLHLMKEKQRGAPGGAGARRRLSATTIPPRLLEVALRRIGTLPKDEREALGVASIDPEGATSDLVARCLGESRMRSLRLLQRLSRDRGLLREVGNRYAVAHAEVRDAAYAGLLPELRAAWHGKMARDLERAGTALTDPARLGRHLRGAGRPAEAVPHLLEAGRRLIRLGSPMDAIDRLNEAMDCRGPEGSPEVELARADALERAGDLEAAQAELERLAGAGVRRAIVRLSVFHRNRGQYALAQEVLERFPRGGGATEEETAEFLLTRAQLDSRRGMDPEALRGLEEAKGLRHALSPEFQLRLLSTTVSVLWRLSRYEEAGPPCEEALALADELDDHDTASVLLYNRALLGLQRGRLEEATADARRMVERASILDSDRHVAFGTLLEAHLLVRTLRLDEARERLASVEPRLQRLQNADLLLLKADRWCQLELARGEGKESLRWADRGLDMGRDLPSHVAGFHAYRAEALLILGEAEGALEAARRSREVLLALGSLPEAEEADSLAARALRRLGREGDERRRFRDAEEAATPRGAIEAALEAPTPDAARVRARRAWDLARDEATRAVVRAGLPRDLLDAAGVPPEA